MVELIDRTITEDAGIATADTRMPHGLVSRPTVANAGVIEVERENPNDHRIP